MLVRHTWGNLKLGSVSASSKLDAGAPVTFVGLYRSVSGLNGRAVVFVTVSNPVSTPVLPIWFEIQT